MKSIIYRYSRRFFLTSEITRRIESRIFILYPSTRYSVINRTAEYLIKIYILAGIVTAGLFLYADFSLYYATISALVVYAVVNSRVYGELDKLEIRLQLSGKTNAGTGIAFLVIMVKPPSEFRHTE